MQVMPAQTEVQIEVLNNKKVIFFVYIDAFQIYFNLCRAHASLQCELLPEQKQGQTHYSIHLL